MAQLCNTELYSNVPQQGTWTTCFQPHLELEVSPVPRFPGWNVRQEFGDVTSTWHSEKAMFEFKRCLSHLNMTIKKIKDISKHPPLAGRSAGFELRVAWLVLCTGTAAEVTGTNDWRSDLSQTTLWDDPTQQGPPPACCPAHWGVEAVSNWENRRARICVFNRKTHPYMRICWPRCHLPFNLWWKSFNLVMVQIEHSEVL